MSARTYSNNIRKLYAFVFFEMFLLLIPVLVPYYQSLGFSMKDVFILQGAFGAFVALLEVPTGYVADAWGRKQSLVVGGFFNLLAYGYLPFAKTFNTMMIFEVLCALAISFMSGADIALLWDSLPPESRGTAEGKQAVARYQWANVGAESIASIIGGLLAMYSFDLVLWARAVTGAVPFFIALTLVEPPGERMSRKSHLKNVGEVFQYIWSGHPKVRLIFVNYVMWSLASFFAVWIFQKHWQTENIPLGAFGFIWAAFGLTTGLVGLRVPLWEFKMGAPRLLVLQGLMPIIAYFGMAWLGGWPAALMGLLLYVTRGFTGVMMREALNQILPTKMRATANSLYSLFFRLVFVFTAPALGWGIDTYGVSPVFVALGTFYVIVFAFLMIPLVRQQAGARGTVSE